MPKLTIPRETQTVLDALHEGVMIIDTEARILYYNKSFERFIGTDLADARLTKLLSLRPKAALPEVVRTGIPQMTKLREDSGGDYFSNIYPIFEDGEIVGGIALVTFMKDAKYLSRIIQELEQKNALLKKRVASNNGTRYCFDNIIAQAEVSLRTKEIAEKAALSDIPVLIEGESGCGKELYAQSIHNASARNTNPFIAVNCATLTPTMLESELFGYEEGAFTGAKKGGKLGLFEAAHGGTLFLDEISEIEASLQSKLLRALQERRIRRLGGISEFDIDVRLICASNVDLKQRVEKGTFRKDIYYRIAVYSLHIPPLRDRRKDILPLVKHFMADIGARMHTALSLSREAEEAFLAYNWPGNLREMRNVLEFSSLMAMDGIILLEHLPVSISKRHNIVPADSDMPLAEKLRRFEAAEIDRALSKFGDSLRGKKEAAHYLGISLASLYSKLKNRE